MEEKHSPASGPSRPPETASTPPRPAAARSSFASDLYHFLKFNRKWWLLPIIVILLLVGVLLVAGGTVPFIYTIF